jgi:hypothetical protein
VADDDAELAAEEEWERQRADAEVMMERDDD